MISRSCAPPNYKNSLPPVITVTKIWLKDSIQPQITNNLELLSKLGKLPTTLETARRMLSQLLNRIRFEYVPAIRERQYFDYVLRSLQETLLATQMQKDDPIIKAVEELNKNLSERATSLRQEFKGATGIGADVSLPTDPSLLFQAFSVNTQWLNTENTKDADKNTLLLSMRGDGIQARYIPSLMAYIADNSYFVYIWGFEEPENSIEQNLAIDLAKDFENVYCQKAQIFVTSHSPAFFTLKGPLTTAYRVYSANNSTEVSQLGQTDDSNQQLLEELGLFRIQQDSYNYFLDRRFELVKMKEEISRLTKELELSSKPILYTEGKTDPIILNIAWRKLFHDRLIPFEIKCCDTLPPGPYGGAGGAGTLQTFLNGVRYDSPHLAIGIFDADKEGQKAYSSLANYFKDIAKLSAKVAQNQKAAAFLLPVPIGREKYAE